MTHFQFDLLQLLEWRFKIFHFVEKEQDRETYINQGISFLVNYFNSISNIEPHYSPESHLSKTAAKCPKKNQFKTDIVEAEIREYAQHFDFCFCDDLVEPCPLDYFKFFNGKLRVESIAKNLSAIPTNSIPSELFFQ